MNDHAVVEWACAVEGAPHRWGETDCLSLIRGLLAVAYERDVMELPRWDSRDGLIETVVGLGGAAAIASRFGCKVGRKRAYTGDVALIPGGDGDLGSAACVIVDQKLLVASPGAPIRFAPLRSLPPDVEIWRPRVS